MTGHYVNVFFDPQTLHGIDSQLNLIQLYDKKNDRSICKAISKETVAILNAVMDFFLGYLFTRL